jgi:hypothetical protein
MRTIRIFSHEIGIDFWSGLFDFKAWQLAAERDTLQRSLLRGSKKTRPASRYRLTALLRHSATPRAAFPLVGAGGFPSGWQLGV